MQVNKIKNFGFTLIELLVVISLIGILTTLLFANLNAGRARARDAQRKSDLKSIQTALRLYYNDKNRYPAHNSSDQIVGCESYTNPVACEWGEPWSVGSVIYMPVLAKDTLAGQSYKYEYDSENDLTTLSACLENKSDEKGIVTTDTSWCSSGWMYQIKL